jgi:hypothetical protein
MISISCFHCIFSMLVSTPLTTIVSSSCSSMNSVSVSITNSTRVSKENIKLRSVRLVIHAYPAMPPRTPVAAYRHSARARQKIDQHWCADDRAAVIVSDTMHLHLGRPRVRQALLRRRGVRQRHRQRRASPLRRSPAARSHTQGYAHAQHTQAQGHIQSTQHTHRHSRQAHTQEHTQAQ